MNYKDILNRISDDIPFAFSRWGDGEWFNINKIKGQNCDGNIYFDDLGDELKKIVSKKQDYFLGVQTLIPYSVNESKKYNQSWVDADVFHKASMGYEIQSFIDILKKKHIVYIGNNTLSNLEFIDEFIEIPLTNSWITKEQVLNEVVNTFDDKHKIYLFSAGMATNYYIDFLWKKNKQNTYIDVGSVFDPFVGRITRGYHRNLKLV
jgi:hypothetical protein